MYSNRNDECWFGGSGESLERGLHPMMRARCNVVDAIVVFSLSLGFLLSHVRLDWTRDDVCLCELDLGLYFLNGQQFSQDIVRSHCVSRLGTVMVWLISCMPTEDLTNLLLYL